MSRHHPSSSKFFARATVSLATVLSVGSMVAVLVPFSAAQAQSAVPPVAIQPPCETTTIGPASVLQPNRITTTGGMTPTPTTIVQVGPDTVTSAPHQTAPCKTYEAQQSIFDKILRSARTALVVGILKASERFTQDLALYAADFITSGLPGQTGVFYTMPFDKFLKNSAATVVDSFVGATDAEIQQQLGFSLCQRPSVNLKLFIGLGRVKRINVPESCTLQKLTENFDYVKDTLSDEQTWKSLAPMRSNQGTDFGVYTSLNLIKLDKVTSAREGAAKTRDEGGGLKPISDILDGNITVPSQGTKSFLDHSDQFAMKYNQGRDFMLSDTMIALQSGFEELPGLVAVSFLNELANNMLDGFIASFKDAPKDQESVAVDPGNPEQAPGTFVPGEELGQSFGEGGGGTEPVQVVASDAMFLPNAGRGDRPPSALSDILSANVFTTEKQDLLLEMGLCNEPRGLWGCTLDQGFVDGLRSRSKSGALSVARAAGLGGNTGVKPFLHLDWQLIPESEARDNQDKGCYQRAYCSANLAKLRFARILPIGWELAANSPYNVKKDGKFVTLDTVLRGFADCNVSGKPDAQHPWCKLINPSWVLVAPAIQCNVKGYSSSVIGQGLTARIQECSELVSCLQMDDKGNCIGGYGACLSDKTVWRFGGSSCDEKFSTCRAYKTRGGQEASYVRSTIDYGSCNGTSVGCWMYSTVRDASTSDADKWLGGTEQAALAGVPINVVTNSSFETTASDMPVGWSGSTANLPSGTKAYATSKQATFATGAPAINLATSAAFPSNGPYGLSQVVTLKPDTNYVVSYYARRVSDPAGAPPSVPDQPGLVAEYFNTVTNKVIPEPEAAFAGTPAVTRNETGISYDFGGVSNDFGISGVNTDFAARWTGYVVVGVTGDYDFNLAYNDGARVFFDDVLVLDKWRASPGRRDVQGFRRTLVADRVYKIKIEYYDYDGDAKAGLSWKSPGQTGFQVMGTSGGYGLFRSLKAPALPTDLTLGLRQLRGSATPFVSVANATSPTHSSNCQVPSDATLTGSTLLKTPATLTDSWQRFTCEFTTKPDARAGLLYLSGTNAAIDAVMLAEGTTVQSYTDQTSNGSDLLGMSFTGPRAYFDATAESCAQSSDGCTKLYKLQDGQPALNLLRNSSFEQNDDAAATKLDAWKGDLVGMSETGNTTITFVYTPVSDTDPVTGSVSYQGTKALYVFGQTTKAIYQTVDMQQLRNYTVSYFARRIDASTDSSSVNLKLRLLKGKDVPEQIVDAAGEYYRSINCTPENGSGASDELKRAQFALSVDKAGGKLSDTWQRFTCEFVSNPGTVAGRIKLSVKNAAVDAVELEESPFATTYIDGVNNALPVIHAKIAPEELACSGDKQVDRRECSNYARTCQQADMGCSGWTEADGTSRVEIPAKLTPADYCPSTCAGYADYRKLPSAFDLVDTGVANDPLSDSEDEPPASFIPARADQCTAEDVGCEEFTSLEGSAAGGEAKSYYSYARACRKPNDPGAEANTYFTWEGSDTTGFQLKTWALLKATAGDFQAAPAPKILRKAGPDGVIKDSSACNADTWKVGFDLDCRQFYDSLGTPYYVYFSQTVLSTAQCIDVRKNDSTNADCTKTGGTFDATAGNCIYHLLPEESNACAAPAAGCRAYIGSGGRNGAVILRETFGGATQVFAPVAVAGAPTTQVSVSNESLLVGDKSLKVQTNSGSGLGTIAADVPSVPTTLYTISFWLKTTNATTPNGEVLVNGASIGTFKPSLEWSRFELGPFLGKVEPTMAIRIRVPHTTYIDEVQVTSLQDTYYVKKGSWVIPRECDVTPEGIPQPKAMLGCREYRDRNGESVFAYRFSRLCKADAIGCTAFVDTRNSADAYAQSFTTKGIQNSVTRTESYKPWDVMYSGDVTVTRPADRYTYVIDEPSARCPESDESCRAFGKAEFDTFGKPSAFKTVYLKDDITKYIDSNGDPSMLCRPSELFCDAYTSQPDGSQPVQSYFRNPNKHVCVWKDRVPLEKNDELGYAKGDYSGWFTAGTPTVPCYPEKLSRGNTFLLEFSGSLNYRGWTAACPRDQGECTMFQDPHDTSNADYPEGKPYFFINNSRIDKASCNGRVDPLAGCVLVKDSSSSVLNYSVAATYAKSKLQGDSPVNPVDCSLTGTRDPSCAGIAQNDANTVVRVKLDRDCATWLGCRSGETLFDENQGKYVDICSDYGVCDKVGAIGSQFCGEFVDRRPPGIAATTGYQEPVLRQYRFIDDQAYAERPTEVTAPEYSGYTGANRFQLVDLTMRAVGFDLLEKFPESIRDKFANDYRLVLAVPLTGTAFADLPGGVSTDPQNAGAKTLDRSSLPSCSGQGLDCYIRNMDLANAPAAAITSKSVTGRIAKSAGSTFVDPVRVPQPTDTLGYYAKYIEPDRQYPYLHLCQHVQSGVVGYYLPSDNPRVCYVAIDRPPSLVASDQLSTTAVNPRNVQNAAALFLRLQASESKINPQLNVAFPPSECKAYPASDAPFSNQYIKSWDAQGNPQEFAPGYDNASYCEKGEDCDCSYRKASYGGVNKYFGPFSTAPIGICDGGNNGGISCSPYQTDKATQVNLTCGEGSRCVPLAKSILVQGLFGQCLQRDASRTVAGNQANSPCLVWNPLPTLRGQTDIFHYSFTAGYIPMPNSGEYYCVANTKPPQDLVLVTDPWFVNASKQQYGVDPDVFPTSGANACPFVLPPSQAAQDKSPFLYDMQQWLVTGGGKDKTYAEYFVRFNAFEWAKYLGKSNLSGVGLNPATWPGSQDVMSSLETKNFSQFKFFAPNNSYLNASICGGSLFVKNSGGSGSFGADFTQQFQPKSGVTAQDQYSPNLSDFDAEHKFIDVAAAKVYIDEDAGQPKKLPCIYSTSDDASLCYYKLAEMGFNADGQQVFTMMDDAHGGIRPLVRGGNTAYKLPYYFGAAKSSAPYFAIRAMFEDGSVNENNTFVSNVAADGSSLNGPWRLVGFWVTVSGGTADVSRKGAMLQMSVLNSPICTEVAQVVSPATRDATPFMDRIWKEAKYRIPVLGYVFGDQATPFGSVPHAAPIGQDPLYHPDVDLVSRAIEGKPRSFPGGDYKIYASDADQPAQNWGWLTNLFARVYRVYRFYDTAVTKTSWACVAGPRFGTWCPNLSNAYDGVGENKPLVEDLTGTRLSVKLQEGMDISRSYCGYDGSCAPLPANTLVSAQGRCNALSGVNSGLACSGSNDDEVSGYKACHAAPLKRVAGNLVPQYAGCELKDPSWIPVSGNRWKTASGQSATRQEMFDAGRFRCEDRAVHYPNGDSPKCDLPTGLSKQCPIQVNGEGEAGEHSECINNRCSGGYEEASCNTDKDCSFTWFEWWNGGINAPKPYEANQLPASNNFALSFLDISGGLTRPTRAIAPYTVPLDLDSGSGASAVRNANLIYPPTEIIKRNNGSVSGDVNNPFLGETYEQIRLPDDGYGPLSAGARTSPTRSKWWAGAGDKSTVPAVDPTTGNTNEDTTMGEDILGSQEFKTGRYAVLYDDSSTLKRFPGAYMTYPLQFAGNYADPNAAGARVTNLPAGLGVFIPGHCERPPVDIAQLKDSSIVKGVPYDKERHVLQPVNDASVPSQFKPWTPGTCTGGAYEGRVCVESSECQPKGVSNVEKARAGLYCQPVTDSDGKPRNVRFTLDTPSNEFIFNCLNPNGDPRSQDPDLDDNSCTHGVGYYPRADLCGGTQNKAECLSALAQGDGVSADVSTSPLPTDVTNGLFSPSYLGAKFATGRLNPLGGIDDRFVSYYTPRPPTIAAPDTTRKCATPGSCPISQVNAFTFESQSEGLVSYSGGQVRAGIKFYAWAADDQGPIKSVLINWGDTTIQSVDDARMKNRKPLCQKPKECQFIQGLGCDSDNDCPAGGGKCVSVGYCNKRPNIRCSTNEDCSVGAAVVDTCNVRTTFGNSNEACQESYFDFAHVYSCTQAQGQALPACGTQLRCSRDPDRNCTRSDQCAPGDSCVADLAPAGGCWDAARTSCRFTPRVMVKDNWGWCTGECRLQELRTTDASNKTVVRLGDAYTATQSASNAGIANYMLFTNGGCYDGSNLSYNNAYNESFGVGSSTHSDASGNLVMRGTVPDIQSYENSCDANIRGSHFRPWVVFNGALQLGVGR